MNTNDNHSFGEYNVSNKEPAEKNEVWEWTKVIVIAFALAYLIRTLLFAQFIVEGESMMPTLHNHDRLIVNKIIYKISQPKFGEIIVFHATPEKDYIKRVVGLPNDVVEMKNDQLIVNGKVVQEEYLLSSLELKHSEGLKLTEDFGPITIPEGHIFVLGDNRGNSTDSRIIGPISLEKVEGRADIIIWPLSDIKFLH